MLGGVKVWRGYGWQTALSAGEKCAEMCFSADISRQSQAASAAPSVTATTSVSMTHTISLMEREMRCVDKKKEERQWEWENEEHGEIEMWKQRRNKKVEELELKWMGDGWYGLEQRLKGITPIKIKKSLFTYPHVTIKVYKNRLKRCLFTDKWAVNRWDWIESVSWT